VVRYHVRDLPEQETEAASSGTDHGCRVDIFHHIGSNASVWHQQLFHYQVKLAVLAWVYFKITNGSRISIQCHKTSKRLRSYVTVLSSYLSFSPVPSSLLAISCKLLYFESFPFPFPIFQCCVEPSGSRSVSYNPGPRCEFLTHEVSQLLSRWVEWTGNEVTVSCVGRVLWQGPASVRVISDKSVVRRTLV
jgi:hypothetical protein